jgi:hypothetical protein
MNRHQRRAAAAQPMRTVIFRRAEGWYPIEVRHDEDLEKHVELNPGTLSIEDMDGNVLR